MNIYEQRWQNANQICRRIDALLTDHLVFNSEGERVFGFTFTETEISYSLNHPGLEGKCKYHVEIYNRSTEWDHGAHDTIEVFNKQFKEWEFCKKVSTEDALMPPLLKVLRLFKRNQVFAARCGDEVSHICEYKRRRGNIVEAYVVNGGWTIRFDLTTGKAVKHDIEICYTDPIPKMRECEDQIEWVAKRLGLTTK